MKTYRSTRLVKAAPIAHVDVRPDGAAVLDLVGAGSLRVTRAWFVRHGPVPGGYFVRYPDGYESFCPAAPFERDHFAVGSDVSFGDAVLAMKAGRRVTRAGWNGQGMFAYLVPAASYPAQTGAAKAHYGEGALVPYRAYLALKTAQGDVATWSPSCSDVLAEDWQVLPETAA